MPTVKVEDTKTGKTFEVDEEHWEQNLWRVVRYKRSDRGNSPGRPRKDAVKDTSTSVEE